MKNSKRGHTAVFIFKESFILLVIYIYDPLTILIANPDIT